MFDSLDTPGGHIVVCLVLLVILLVAGHFGYSMSDVFIGEVLDVLVRSMIGAGPRSTLNTLNLAGTDPNAKK